MYRNLRDFVGRAVRVVADEGVEQFLVLGAGTPTQGNVHEIVPSARVLYTDIDPENIAFGREVLSALPGVDYAYCDAAAPGTLDQEAAERILDPTARIGVVLVGLSTSLEDRELRNALSDLFDWVPPGSLLVADLTVRPWPPIRRFWRRFLSRLAGRCISGTWTESDRYSDVGDRPTTASARSTSGAVRNRSLTRCSCMAVWHASPLTSRSRPAAAEAAWRSRDV